MALLSAGDVKALAVELGFNLVGITRAEPSPTLDAYERWVEAGMQGEMNYLARPDRQARRRDLNVILPGVRSMIVVGLDYRTHIPESVLSDPSRGRIALYAWGLDYHHLLAPRLEQLAERIGAPGRVYVDTGAILERSHAYTAGMGFIGKNTMLIHPRRGSYFFLGELLTDREFDEYDTPGAPTMCGQCTRCLNACPTNAFPRPHVLDARRCISYLTIEYKGAIPHDLRPLMGNYVFGCDICQDVCPWQRFAPLTDEPLFHPADIDRAAPPLLDLLGLDEPGFNQRFAGSPLARPKRERLVRNACVAAGNWGSDAALPALAQLLTNDPSPLIRGHAAWALGRVDGGRVVLAAAGAHENEESVRQEIRIAMENNLPDSL